MRKIISVTIQVTAENLNMEHPKIAINGLEYQECELYPKPAVTIGNKLVRDIRKPWTIVYYQFSTLTNKTERILVKKYNHIKEHEQRLRACTELMNQINGYLQQGYVHNPIKVANPVPNIQEADLNNKLIDELTEFLNAKNITDSTKKTYNTILNIFRIFLSAHKIENIKVRQFTAQWAKAYNKWMVGKYSPKTTNEHTIFLSGYFRENEFDNPFKKIALLPVPESDKHELFKPEHLAMFEQQMRANDDLDLLLFIKIAYYCFLRLGKELINLKVGDIDEFHLKVPARNHKEKVVHRPIIPAELNKLLDEFKIRDYNKDFYVFGNKGRPSVKNYSYIYMYARFKQKYLIPNNLVGVYTLYGMKHTGNNALMEQLNDIYAVQAQNGHKSLAMTERYLRKYQRKFNKDLYEKFK